MEILRAQERNPRGKRSVLTNCAGAKPRGGRIRLVWRFSLEAAWLPFARTVAGPRATHRPKGGRPASRDSEVVGSRQSSSSLRPPPAVWWTDSPSTSRSIFRGLRIAKSRNRPAIGYCGTGRDTPAPIRGFPRCWKRCYLSAFQSTNRRSAPRWRRSPLNPCSPRLGRLR